MHILDKIRKNSHELDPCTKSNYQNFKVLNTELSLDISFDEKKIYGIVKYSLKNLKNVKEVILDTSHLAISNVNLNNERTNFEVQSRKEPYGSPLVIPLTSSPDIQLEIKFNTTDKCTAIQFIQGDTGPYVFSQCQAIHARSLFPCFDTPSVKSTYQFRAKSPYVSLMSGRPQSSNEKDVYYFEQPIPIPSYLISITSGNLHHAPIGPRSEIYTELPNLRNCQWEFEKDMENFIQIAEKLIFEYEWLRYDALVLPVSFPYGGMEIPNYTQVTPTLISKDRSQIKVMAHELAHSWSGNLVTNNSWEHFWLNEGWTVYLERRILGGIATAEAKKLGKAYPEKYGEQVRHFSAIIGWNSLVDAVNNMDPKFTSIICNLENLDPDDAFSRIPYEKGFNFLFHIETMLGGIAVFDAFIKYYFKKFRYLSTDSYQFIDSLYEFYQPLGKKEILDSIDWETWLFGQGLPPQIPKFGAALADECYLLVDKWVEFFKSKKEEINFNDSDIKDFQSDQHMLFIETLTKRLNDVCPSSSLIQKLPEVYSFYAFNSNSEIKSRWNELLIKYGKYNENDEVVKNFADWLGTIGRMKYVRPGYKLLQNSISKEFAIDTFSKFEARYHPICKTMIKKDLNIV